MNIASFHQLKMKILQGGLWPIVFITAFPAPRPAVSTLVKWMVKYGYIIPIWISSLPSQTSPQTSEILRHHLLQGKLRKTYTWKLRKSLLSYICFNQITFINSQQSFICRLGVLQIDQTISTPSQKHSYQASVSNYNSERTHDMEFAVNQGPSGNKGSISRPRLSTPSCHRKGSPGNLGVHSIRNQDSNWAHQLKNWSLLHWQSTC